MQTFWGVEVKHGVPLQVDPEEDTIVVISKAVLDEQQDNGNEQVRLDLTVGGQNLCIGTLSHDRFPQLSTRIVLDRGFVLSHSWRNGSVFFSGYKGRNKVEAEEEGSDEAVPKRRKQNGKSRLKVDELLLGDPNGQIAKCRNWVSVHLTGRLKKNGQVFYSSVGKPPVMFCLGEKHVIKGLDVGVTGMRVGGKRRLTIPPAMGYGAEGTSGNIPPDAWLVFKVELVGVARALHWLLRFG